jgi:hypothetical protein
MDADDSIRAWGTYVIICCYCKRSSNLIVILIHSQLRLYIVKMPYPESRLYAQDRYDQAARDNVHSHNGDKKLQKRQEAWLRKLEQGPLDEPRCKLTPLLLTQRDSRGPKYLWGCDWPFPLVRDLRTLKHGYAVLLKQRENRRSENLNAARADLQQRHNEEVAFIRLVTPFNNENNSSATDDWRPSSEARSEDGRPYNLPEEMCIKIADNNNKPAKWDKDLIRTNSTKSKKADVDYKTQTDISTGHQSVHKLLDELRLNPRHLQRWVTPSHHLGTPLISHSEPLCLSYPPPWRKMTVIIIGRD